jgi:hypothetical protein
MITTKNFKIASSLILLAIILGIALVHATTENNYKNDNNFLTNISESIHTESGYKTNIVINPNIAGICANENGYKLDLSINTQGIGGSLNENGYKLDLIPEKTFSDIPDVTITKIITSKTVVGQGYSLLINVTVANQALNYETFYITINANTPLKEQKITLTSMKSTTITFKWNTTGFAKGKYTIWAYVWPVSSEINTANNQLTYGQVKVVTPGNVNGDNIVNMIDIYTELILRFMCQRGDPGYRANSDINDNGIINYQDIYTAILHFMQTEP